MKPFTLFVICSFAFLPVPWRPAGQLVDKRRTELIAADNPNIQYTGRIDFSDPKKPRFWAPGVYVKANFKGPACEIVINDEELYKVNHNYIEVVVDDRPPLRIQTSGASNTIKVAEGLSDGAHSITICKDTESGIGYLEFLGFKCAGLLPLPPKQAKKLEFIGDSITCGTGSDLSRNPCGKGQWYDQHNAYWSYGPSTARILDAQWCLTAVSGIGMVNSCCGMTIAMPEVFDKLNQRENVGQWNFNRYQPDAVTICLGQNDGTRDPDKFREAYIKFIERIRAVYPLAEIVCLTSPMADAALTTAMQANLTKIVDSMNTGGDLKVHKFFFSRRYHSGCGGHPDLEEHRLIANELAAFLRSALGW